MQIAGLVIVAGILFGIGLLILVNQPKRKSSNRKTNGLNKEEIKLKWLQVEETSSLGGPSNFKTAIMEADKLVDFALILKGAKGNNMGERLKDSKKLFNNYKKYDNLWYAHKTRNSIAHDINHDLLANEAKKSLNYFKEALIELGVL